MISPDDREYETCVLETVTREGEGYVLETRNGSLWVPGSDFEPKAGQTAHFYGEGLGRPVRGVTVEGRVLYYRTAEEEQQRQREASEKFHRETVEQEQRVTASGRDEASMRLQEVPWLKSLDELTAYIKALSEGEHTYGTCVYAISLSAVATFHYVASTLGCTGFQASLADLDVLRRTRHLDGPFMIVKAEDALYPQSDVREKLDKAMETWLPWLAEQATTRLADPSPHIHPDVKRHWEHLAKITPDARD